VTIGEKGFPFQYIIDIVIELEIVRTPWNDMDVNVRDCLARILSILYDYGQGGGLVMIL
jgi:hypothetical protein